MKLCWLTDTHLDFLDHAARHAFYQKLQDQKTDGILISGDIADGRTVCDILLEMLAYTQKPIYFVLGNHDYYHSSVAILRATVSALCADHPQLHWLSESPCIALTPDTVLVGDDTWADGRYGDYANSGMVLNDSRLIQELYAGHILGRFQLLDAMQQLADADAVRLKKHLVSAIAAHQPKKIIVLVHVPPFIENCTHEGAISGPEALPFFASQITGEVLRSVAAQHPEVAFHVLCGHSHSAAMHQPLSHMTVQTGAATYMQPEIVSIITL